MINDKSTESSDDAPMSTIPLNMTEAAFHLAKRGDDRLLRVLLGPSIPAEKSKNIEINAQIDTWTTEERLYEFMFRLTQARLAVIEEFKTVSPDYRDFDVLNAKLAGASGDTITKMCEAFEIVGSVNGQYCVELNDMPLIEIDLEIDQKQHVVSLVKRHSGEQKQSSIKMFLSAHGIRFDAEAKYAHFRLNDAYREAMKEVWFKRFTHRASMLPLERMTNDAELERCKLQLKQDEESYQCRMDYCSNQKLELITQQNMFENAFVERCNQQKVWIDDYHQCPAPLPGENFEDYFRLVKILLKFTLGEEEVMHLAGTADEPKKIWVPYDVTDVKGNTLMHVAAENHRYRTVNALLKYGLRVNKKNNDGVTPAMLANEDEAELENKAAIFGRDKESNFLEAERKMIVKYKKRAEGILASRWSRFWYSLAHNVEILQERVNVEVPELLNQLAEAYQDISDMQFAIKVFEMHDAAKRGLRTKSQLHDQAFKLAVRYLRKRDFGVKLESEVEKFIQEAGMGTPQGKKEFEMQLKAKTKELKDLVAHFNKAMQLQGEAIANLQSENGALKASLERERESSSGKDQLIAEQEARINQQGNELKALSSQVKEQGAELKCTQESLKNTQDSLKRMEAMMAQLLNNKEAQSVPSSSPMPIPHAHNKSVIFPVNSGSSSIPPSLSDGIQMDEFVTVGVSPME